MVEELTQTIIEAIRQNGSQSVFWGAVIEQLLGVLIPSPIVPMSAGFLLIPQHLPFSSALIFIIRRISFPYALGVVIGASFFYLVALFGGRVLIDKYGKFFGLSLKNVDKFRNKFTRGFKDEVLIFLLLVLPVTSISLVSASCGLIGISGFEFYPLLLAGVFFRSILLAFLGWGVGESYQSLVSGLDKTESLLSVGVVGTAFLALIYLYYRREKYLKKN